MPWSFRKTPRATAPTNDTFIDMPTQISFATVRARDFHEIVNYNFRLALLFIGAWPLIPVEALRTQADRNSSLTQPRAFKITCFLSLHDRFPGLEHRCFVNSSECVSLYEVFY